MSSPPDYDDSVHLLPADREHEGVMHEQLPQSQEDLLRHTVHEIIHQAQTTQAADEPLRDTIFYHYVQEGQVNVVSRVLQDIQNKKHLLGWLKGDQLRTLKKPQIEPGFTKPFALDVLKLVVVGFILFCLTPGFYVFHSFTCFIYASRQNNLLQEACLPLYWACCSLNEDMIRLLLQMGISPKDCDLAYNNVFHYIAEHARIDNDKAVQMLEMLVGVIGDVKFVRKLIHDNRNAAGMTALEIGVQDASTDFYEHVMQHNGVLSDTLPKLSVPSTVGGSKIFGKLNDSQPVLSSRQTYVDITHYERGPYLGRSKILRFICDINCTKMSEEALKFVNKEAFLGCWMSAKIKQKIVPILLVQLFDVLLTSIFVFYVSTILRADFTNTQMDRATSLGLSKELQARQNGSSFLWHKTQLPFVRHRIELHLAHQLIDKQIGKTYFLYSDMDNVTSKMFVQQYLTVVPDDILANITVDSLFDKAEKFLENDINNTARQHLPWCRVLLYDLTEITSHFAKDILKSYPLLHEAGNNKLDFNYSLEQFETFAKAYKTDYFAANISALMTPEYWLEIFCTPLFLLPKKCLLRNLSFPAPMLSNVLENSCEHFGAEYISNKLCPPSLADMLYFQLEEFSASLISISLLASWTVILVTSVGFIYIDYHERMALAIYTLSDKCIDKPIESYLSHSLPGSHIRRQMGVLAHGCTLGYLFLSYIGEQLDNLHWLVTISKYLMILALLLRFILHIHTLRLVPFIGHFITTTFTMLHTLLYFAVVYVAVLFIFAVMFHILANKSDCPVVKEGNTFSAVAEGMFTSFQLAFGHGDMDVFFAPTAVRFAYILYVAIIALMLLNLLIAMMTVTAAEITKLQYQKALTKIELLKEALAIEHTIFALFKQGNKIFAWIDLKAGYVIRRVGKENRFFMVAPKRYVGGTN